MKKRLIRKKIIQYYKECGICGKEIYGTTENQVAFNLGVHKNSKDCKKRVNEKCTTIDA